MPIHPFIIILTRNINVVSHHKQLIRCLHSVLHNNNLTKKYYFITVYWIYNRNKQFGRYRGVLPSHRFSVNINNPFCVSFHDLREMMNRW